MENIQYKIGSCSRIRDLPADVLSIFDDADKNIFYSRGWFDNYENTIDPDVNSGLIYFINKIISNGDRFEPVAIHLMDVKKESNVLFSYNKITSLANYYSTYHNVLLRPGSDYPAVIDVLADELNKNKNTYPVFNLSPVVEDDEIANLLSESLRRKGWFIYYYKMFGNWRLHLNERDFEDYYQTVPSRTRNTIKRKEKKLIKEHEVEYRLFLDATDIELAILSFNKVYNDSWKAKEPYPEFVGGLINVCAENGWLRLGVLNVDGRPVAAQLWIVKDDIAYIYKLAYTEESRRLSAGSILTRNLFKHVIDVDKVKIIDYLTGDDAYKKDWMSERRQMVGLMAYSNTYKGRVLTLWYKTKKQIKSIMNKADE